MKPFLQQVAAHYFAEGGIGDKCFIFPNRRSLAFFKKYLGEEVERSGRACLAPMLYTMNDFFYGIAGKTPTSQIQLLVHLYQCYTQFVPKAETLDDFLFWGNVILSDFNDVDKYLVQADSIFANVADFRRMQESGDFLSETQKNALERFLGNFDTPSEYKDRFLGVWSVLAPLYRKYNARLQECGCCYEGQVYRSVAESLAVNAARDVLPERFQGVDCFVFVGLNALNECEKRLLGKLRDARMAQFCWDYVSDLIREPHNKSSLFLSENVQMFPQAFDLDEQSLPQTEFNVMSVPSSVGQAKQLPSVLRRLGKVGLNTAVIIPDEQLLIPVLNSIPEEITSLNVTMGYPLSGSELSSLMRDIADLQMRMRVKDGRNFFYHKQVWSIFSNSVFKSVISGEEKIITGNVRKSARYYIPEEELRGGALLELIFKPSGGKPGEYLQNIVSYVASALKQIPDMEIELDFAREYYLSVGQLDSCEGLDVEPSTFFRLLANMVRSSSVPFLGEPLEGLQIMGPLETRALDFDNVIILSCNEGIFPHRAVSSSFIPPELRKGFSLPTYEYQDAVWAYYFYRLIQRASNVWMLYDSRSEISRSGEPSRYISQLELHFGVKMNKFVMSAPLVAPAVPEPILKTPEMLQELHGKYLSVSSVQTYQVCPAKFYYAKVCGLRPDDEVTESLDASGLGTVFHETMKALYSEPADGFVSCRFIGELLKDKELIRSRVRERLLDNLKSIDISGRNVISEDIVCSYVENTLKSDMSLLKSENLGGFRVIGLELTEFGNIGGFNFKGTIDRIDSFRKGNARIVDYKTGTVDKDKVGLQLYVYYSLLKDRKEVKDCDMEFSIYDIHRLFVSPVENILLSEDDKQHYKTVLDDVLSEISDIELPFERRGDQTRFGTATACDNCEFRQICGK
ncbi:MAG: PD-(D/E)XK nuclease family protein [Bacteroidales bacterium]|nr:PD-(D/E)XK nuclease family protein [Bacteroidales bacterium]